MGCERNPIGQIHTAARIRVRGPLRDAVPEDDEHPGHLINTSIQAREVGRRQHPEVVREKDMIVELPGRTQRDR